MKAKDLVLLLLLCLCWLGSPFLAIAVGGDKMLFDRAVALSKTTDDGLEKLRCVEALAGLRLERETWQILQTWSPADGDKNQEGKLRSCWENELYWAGMNLAEQSTLPLSTKLASLGGGRRVPPDQLVTQLLRTEAEMPTPLDQDMVALLRFAALYDQTVQQRPTEEDLSDVAAAAVDVAPRALRLLESSYPPDCRDFHFHPVHWEVDLCSLAILSIIPGPDRDDALRKLEENVSDNFPVALECARRGWIGAAETGFDLAGEDAAFAWRTALLETLNVDLRDASTRATKDRVNNSSSNEHRALQLWRSSIRGLMEDLRTKAYVRNPERLSRYLQESDDELWRVQMLFILEAARIHDDGGLLNTATSELIQQSDRVYDNSAPIAGEDSARDLTVLYHSALRAAERVDNVKLWEDLYARLISLVPTAFGEVFDHPPQIPDPGAVLLDFDEPVLAWIRAICTSRAEHAVIEEFENAVFKVQARSPFSALGASWAVSGPTRAKMEHLLQRCESAEDELALAYGAGLAVGFGGCPFGLCEMWRLLEKNGCGKSLPYLTALTQGYVDARNDPYKRWSVRFVQELAR